MRQLENRAYGSAGLGRKKMRAADAIAKGERIYKRRKDVEQRNAYREACGLPLIEPGKGLLAKAHDAD